MNLKVIICYFLLICAAHAGDGGFAITVEPNDAEIYIDGQLKAITSPTYQTVSEGKHLVEVKKAGMKTEQFEILISAEGTVVKKIVLTTLEPSPVPVLPPAPIVETKPETKTEFLDLLQPERGKFETEAEFWERRTQLLIQFNQKITAHQAEFQIGTATLDHENYDLDSGTFPVKIELAEWAKKFIQPVQRHIAALRDDAQNLWKEGEKKPLFAYFKLGKHIAEVDKIVLIGLNKEWRVESVTGHLFAAFPPFFNELFNSLSDAYKTKFPYVYLHPTVAKIDSLFNQLVANETNIIVSHREITNEEIAAFEKKYEYKPVGIRLALKIYAIYVHKDNPLKGIDGVIRAIFSAPKTCSNISSSYQTWGDVSDLTLQIDDNWKSLPIEPIGVKADTLTHQIIKEIACDNQLSPTLKFVEEQQVPEFVSKHRGNIGFAELQKFNPDLPVRALPFYNPKEHGIFSSGMIEPSEANALSGKYRLVQHIWIYVNKPPKATLPPVEQEFIDFILSSEGQNILQKQRFVALPREKRVEELEKLK